MKKRKPSNKIIFTSITIISLILFSSVYLSNGFENGGGKYSLLIKKNPITEKSVLNSIDAADGQQNFHKEFVVGAIIPFTGSYASIGKSTKVALEKAEYDVNKYFEKMNSSSRFNLVMANSKSSPEDSLEAIKQLHSFGAKIIVGPATSTAVSAAKEYADTNNIILISYSSTSPLLSLEGDNLFRLVPDDINQGKVIAQRMIDDGIKVVVPIWRGDIYGNELYKSTKNYFEKLGGKIEEGINYKPHTGKFATSLHRINFIMWNQYLKKLSHILENATRTIDPRHVGIYLVSFDEVTPILIQSNEHHALQQVKWYGSDASAQNMQIIRNHDAARFAEMINFSNPLFHVNLTNSSAELIEKEIEKKLHGSSALTYPVLAYDAFWVTALSLEKIIDNKTYDNNTDMKIDIDSLKKVINATAAEYNGISGNIILNAVGDRTNANYDMWSVARPLDDRENYVWKHNIAGNYSKPPD